MKRRFKFLRTIVVTTVAIAGGAAAAVAADYQVLGDDAESFRSDFNASAQKVRAVFLVAPT